MSQYIYCNTDYYFRNKKMETYRLMIVIANKIVAVEAEVRGETTDLNDERYRIHVISATELFLPGTEYYIQKNAIVAIAGGVKA